LKELGVKPSKALPQALLQNAGAEDQDLTALELKALPDSTE
jgi:hypothetical protein